MPRTKGKSTHSVHIIAAPRGIYCNTSTLTFDLKGKCTSFPGAGQILAVGKEKGKKMLFVLGEHERELCLL